MTDTNQLPKPDKPLTLNDILPGLRVRIKRHNATGPVRQRLLDLGVMPNVSILVVRAAPLNDPIELRLEATDITLRRREAATVEVIEEQDD
nr:FeoA domain-containing protein [uncultured Cohaesibacter sp.]